MDYLLHLPWWVAILIAVVGVWLFVVGNRRMDKTLRRVGTAIAIVAVLLGIVGLVYLTPLQKAEARTKALVQDVNQQDWGDLGQRLDDETVVEAVGQTVAVGRGNIVTKFRSAYNRFGVKSVTSMSVQGIQTDTLITVTVTVVSTQDYTQDQPVPSTWELDFQENGQIWELEKISLIRVNGEDTAHPFNPF
ncbi:MAG: hypothetical protein ABSF29_07605 [Tepidisphaeraceae bacterium]|jgi:predicted PurR-regulated permease PerM